MLVEVIWVLKAKRITTSSELSKRIFFFFTGGTFYNHPGREGPCKEKNDCRNYRNGKKETSRGSVNKMWNKMDIRARKEEKKMGSLSQTQF